MSIPSGAREFDRWAIERAKTWPLDLQLLAGRTLLTLKSLDQPAAAQSPAFMEASRADLMAFAEAYGRYLENHEANAAERT